MKYHNILLFILCSLIWGTTWQVIKFQINSISPVVGVFYRFLLASVLMFAFNFFVTKKSLSYPLKNHLFFFLQGLFNFSLNYILTYITEEKLSSGLVALTFTTLVYFNMLGMRLWFKKRISPNVIVGGFFGFMGIILLFWNEIHSMQAGSSAFLGLLLGILATFFASTGNMFAFKNHQLKVPVVVFNSFGMLYGSIASLTIGLIRHEHFALPTSSSFLLSLFYLSIFGTVIAFWAYQTLVGTIGAERAAYSSIISPMIAVIISSFFENIKFTSTIMLGITFCLLGNLFSLKRSK